MQVGKCETRSVSGGLRLGVREGAGLGVCISMSMSWGVQVTASQGMSVSGG